MISDLKVEDYQSLAKAHLVLKGMTVITGPSNSGKSAVIRALRLAAFNQRGTAFIRHGARSCRVAVGIYDEQVAIGIERGKGKDSYRLVTPGEDDDGKPDVVTYTKLAGGVPEAIEGVLRLSGVNFAGQLDSPFLLTSSGAEVARRLGELTNVSILLEAAREAERRRRQVQGDLRREEERLEALSAQLHQYATLRRQREVTALAEKAVKAACALDARFGRANGLTLVLIRREAEAASMAAALRAAPVPSLEIASALALRCKALRGRVTTLEAAESALEERSARAARARGAAEFEDKGFHDALLAAGRCPTCRQRVEPLGMLGARLFGE